MATTAFHPGGYSGRPYGSFSGKATTILIGDPEWRYSVTADDLRYSVAADDLRYLIAADDLRYRVLPHEGS